jgi:hypothetical protein
VSAPRPEEQVSASSLSFLGPGSVLSSCKTYLAPTPSCPQPVCPLPSAGSMIQTAHYPAMETSVAAHRPEYEESQASGGMQSPISRVPAARALPPRTADSHSMQPPLTINTAEGRARKRFQRTTSENEDPLRKSGFSIPFGRQNNTSNAAAPSDQKMPQHARRRSTLRDNKAPLLGPRPLQNNRYGGCAERLGYLTKLTFTAE